MGISGQKEEEDRACCFSPRSGEKTRKSNIYSEDHKVRARARLERGKEGQGVPRRDAKDALGHGGMAPERNRSAQRLVATINQ